MTISQDLATAPYYRRSSLSG